VDQNGNFFTINPSNGNTNTVGNTGITGTFSLGVSLSGTFYTVDGNDDLYSVNPATAAATEIAPLSSSSITVTRLHLLAGRYGILLRQ
jgi:hypothetical protein